MTTESPHAVDVHDAEAELSELVKRVQADEGITISRRGKPVAKLIPLPADFDAERNTVWEGKIWLDPDIEQSGGELLYASAEAWRIAS